MNEYYVKLTGEAAKLRHDFYIHKIGDITIPTIRDLYQDEEDATIWCGNLDEPMLKINEKVYISDLDKTVRIEDIVRSIDGGYICETDYFELIEDGETVRTKELAESKEREYHRQRELDSNRADIELLESKTKKWYQFWK